LTEAFEKGLKRIGITISKPVLAIICIVFGILAMIFEPFLRYIVGIFLIIEGVLLLTEYFELQRQQQPKSA
jgi:uncharacterized membrane protein HdeD (DUF308 family)